MSRSSWIQISCGSHTSVCETLMALLGYGWSFEDQSRICLLPLGDKGEFNWIWLSISEKREAFEIFKQKEMAGEIVGVTLTWCDSDIGINALFHPEGTFSFSLLINRKPIDNSEFTDVSWYLAKIIPPLQAQGIVIEHIKWEEFV